MRASLAGEIGTAFDKLGQRVAEVNPDNLSGAARPWAQEGCLGAPVRAISCSALRTLQALPGSDGVH